MKKVLYCVVFAVMLCTSSVWGQRNEYPRPQFERAEWMNLNGTWTYEIDPTGSGVETIKIRRGLEGKF